jgi:hypothetical protein
MLDCPGGPQCNHKQPQTREAQTEVMEMEEEMSSLRPRWSDGATYQGLSLATTG